MDSSNSSRQDSLWLQGTRRNTRSSSNQDKDAKSTINDSKNQGQNFDSTETKRRDVCGSGHVVRGQNNEVIEYITQNGISYKLFGSAYTETERPDHPYSICTIQEIKIIKKDNAVVGVKWYYRPSEVPDSVYQMLVKYRFDGVADEGERSSIGNMETRNRELFISEEDVIEPVPVSRLRGECTVKHFSSFQAVKDYDLKADSFFYILGYNPETRRLTNTQGEVLVGPSHQWTASTRGIFYKAVIPDLLPPLPPCTKQVNEEYEELVWESKSNDCDLIMYLRSARSMAAFAGMCDGGSPEEGCVIASRDETTINALNVLFECKGDTRAAIQCLVKKPVPITIERKWTEDQVKRFQKGLRLNGKNFHKIRKDQLPSKETSELVEFYYLSKKVENNLMVQPQSKLRRQTALKRNAKPTTPPTETGEGSSSDIESLTEESEKEQQDYVCTNCQTTTSDDWKVGGKEGLMLCTKCRIFFKKYGDDTKLKIDFNTQTPSDFGDVDRRTPLLSLFTDSTTSEKVPPPFMFKPIKEKMHGETLEPMSVDEDGGEIADVKKTTKRQWKEDGKGSSDDGAVEEKRNKSDEKNSETEDSNTSSKADGSPSNAPSTNRLKEEGEKVKQETADGRRGPLIGAPLPLNPFMAARFPYPQYPVAYPGVPPFPPHPSGVADVKKEVSVKHEPFQINKKDGGFDEKKHLVKTEVSPSHLSSYPLSVKSPFHPAPAPSIRGRALPSGDPRLPGPPHLYWSNAPKSMAGGDALSTDSNLPRHPQSPPGNPEKSRLSEEENRKPCLPSNDDCGSSVPISASSDIRISNPPPQNRSESTGPSRQVEVKTTSADHRTRPMHESNQQNTNQQGQALSQDEHGRPKTENTEGNRASPLDVVCTSDESTLPIYPEHHVTIPGGQNWPLRFKFYEDGLPGLDKSRDPIVCFKGKKVRMSSYPGFLCSRTDFAWISPKLAAKQEIKQQQQRQQEAVKPVAHQPSSRPPPEKERDAAKPRSKEGPSAHAPSEPVHIKREPSRTYPSHFRPPFAPHSSHTNPHNGRGSTPIHTPTPASVSEASKHLPPHSSPYGGGLGPNTSALETLRQYANIDSQREAMSSMLAPTPSPFPFHVPQSERDLRERELRERELRERMPKQSIHAKLLESLDPHAAATAQAMAMQGVHPGMVQAAGLLNQQQQAMRQAYPGPFMGLPGAPSVVPGAVPGLHPMLANPEALQNAVEMDRIAAEQRMHAVERAALEQYRMDLLHSHQHSHVHSHVHLHPQNAPPPGGTVIPPSAVAPSDPMLNPYTVMALQAQTQALAAGLDPVQAASMNQMLSFNGMRGPPAIMPPPGMPVAPQVLSGRPNDPLLLSASQHLQAVAHENIIEQHHRAAQAQQQDYMMRMGFMQKP